MSFASEIKQALVRVTSESECCMAAELAAIVCFAGVRSDGAIKIKTENSSVCERAAELICTALDEDCFSYNAAKKKSGINTLTIEKEHLLDKIFALTEISPDTDAPLCPSADICTNDCCRAAFLRGAFLGGGSASDPEKNYHAEFVTKTPPLADILYEILLTLGISAKITVRKNSFVVYIKDSEAIASLLGIMGAGTSMMDFYNIKIERELRNTVNRQVNCDNANLDKVTDAAQKHIAAINRIRETAGLELLSPLLREAARVRTENPEMSLKELGQLLDPPIGKSGINHRLERICEIADSLG